MKGRGGGREIEEGGGEEGGREIEKGEGWRNIYLSKNKISYLVVDKSAFGEVDQAIAVEIWVSIVQEGEV